jgi:hypothetical protein
MTDENWHTILTAEQFQRWEAAAAKIKAVALILELDMVANQPSRENLILAAQAARWSQSQATGDNERIAGEIAAEIEASLGPR